jgi:hypothetical protein
VPKCVCSVNVHDWRLVATSKHADWRRGASKGRNMATELTRCRGEEGADRPWIWLVQMVFSSSATVYGNPEYTPLDEEHRLEVQLPSSHAHILAEPVKAEPWHVTALSA